MALATISKYANKVEEALEMLGGKASAAECGWPLGPSRAPATLPCGEGRAGW